MIDIHPIAQTDDSVTLSRADYEALIEALEDARDIALMRQIEARVAAGEDEYVPIDVAESLLAGESPVRVWRRYRGLSARALAHEAGVSTTYLSEIETGRKPGSLATMARIARALGVSLDDLAP
jgi:DNA-binding XRE family transcriptional regulator